MNNSVSREGGRPTEPVTTCPMILDENCIAKFKSLWVVLGKNSHTVLQTPYSSCSARSLPAGRLHDNVMTHWCDEKVTRSVDRKKKKEWRGEACILEVAEMKVGGAERLQGAIARGAVRVVQQGCRFSPQICMQRFPIWGLWDYIDMHGSLEGFGLLEQMIKGSSTSH